MNHIKKFEALSDNHEKPSKEKLERLQSELEDFLLDELDTYELKDETMYNDSGSKYIREIPGFKQTRHTRFRYEFSIKFKSTFLKNINSLSDRLKSWDNNYDFRLISIECQSTSYLSEEREENFTYIKITFDL